MIFSFTYNVRFWCSKEPSHREDSFECHGRISTVPGTIVYWAGTPALEGFEGQ